MMAHLLRPTRCIARPRHRRLPLCLDPWRRRVRWPNRFGVNKVSRRRYSNSFWRESSSAVEKIWSVTMHNLFDSSTEDSGNWLRPDEWCVMVSFSRDRNCIQINYKKRPWSDKHFFLLLSLARLWNVHTIKRVSVWAGLTLASAHERENDSGSCMICSGDVFCSLLFRPSPRSHLQG